MASSRSAEPDGEGKLLLVTMAAAPCRGRLSSNVLDALEVDDVHGTSHWLQNPSTHIEDTESTKRQTALIWAARHGAEQCVRLLLDAGARVDAEMAAGASALYIASQQGETECVRALIGAGADPCTSRHDTGTTALMVACHGGHASAVKLLLDAGADSETVSRTGANALFVAADLGRYECVQLLVSAGAAVGSLMTSLPAAAAVATTQASNDTVECDSQRESRVDKSIEDQEQCRAARRCCRRTRSPSSRARCVPLHAAARGGHAGVLQLLLAAGADPDELPRYKHWIRTDTMPPPPPPPAAALLECARDGRVECVRLLVEGGADVNRVCDLGAAAPHLHYLHSQYQVVPRHVGATSAAAIAEASHLAVASPTAQQWMRVWLAGQSMGSGGSGGGGTALLAAAARGQATVVAVLLAAGADVSIAAADGSTALTVAAAGIAVSDVDAVFGRRWDKNSYAGRQDSRAQHARCVRLLLAAGANPNDTLDCGVTALHLALRPGRWRGEDWQSATEESERGDDGKYACDTQPQTEPVASTASVPQSCALQLIRAGACPLVQLPAHGCSHLQLVDFHAVHGAGGSDTVTTHGGIAATPLLAAAENGDPAVVHELLEAGAIQHAWHKQLPAAAASALADAADAATASDAEPDAFGQNFSASKFNAKQARKQARQRVQARQRACVTPLEAAERLYESAVAAGGSSEVANDRNISSTGTNNHDATQIGSGLSTLKALASGAQLCVEKLREAMAATLPLPSCYRGGDGGTPMHGRLQRNLLRAIAAEDIRVVEAWLRDERTHIDDSEEVSTATNDVTASHAAAKGGNVDNQHEEERERERETELLRGAGRGHTALVWAARRNASKTLQRLLDAGACPDVPMAGPGGATALYIAAQEGNVGSIRALLAAGASPARGRADNGAVPLYIAAQRDRIAAVRCLLDQGGANPNAALRTRVLAPPPATLGDAARDDTSAVTRKKSPPLLGMTVTGTTALQLAVQQQRLQMARELLQGGADPNIVRGTDGRTALLMASERASTIGAVAEHRATPDDEDSASEHMVRLLLGAGADINAAIPAAPAAVSAARAARAVHAQAQAKAQVVAQQSAAGSAAAAQASQTAQAAGAVAAAAAKALVSGGVCAAFASVVSGRLPVLACLLDHGADPDSRRAADGATALLAATQRGELGGVRLLLAAGANPDASIDGCKDDGQSSDNAFGESGGGAAPLHVAAQRGDEATLAMLLHGGASNKLALADGATALYIAAQRGHNRCVEHLLAHARKGRAVGGAADVNAARSGGSTALMAAVQRACDEGCGTNLDDVTVKGGIACVAALLRGGAEPNRARADGTTASHTASRRGHALILRWLLGAGANPDAVARDSSTPLLLASSEGHLECVRLLLACGACYDRPYCIGNGRACASGSGHSGSVGSGGSGGFSRFSGFTALDFALARSHAAVSTALREAGASSPSTDAKSLIGKRVVLLHDSNSATAAAAASDAKAVNAIAGTNADIIGIATSRFSSDHNLEYKVRVFDAKVNSTVERAAKLLRVANGGQQWVGAEPLQGPTKALEAMAPLQLEHEDSTINVDDSEVQVDVADGLQTARRVLTANTVAGEDIKKTTSVTNAMDSELKLFLPQSAVRGKVQADASVGIDAPVSVDDSVNIRRALQNADALYVLRALKSGVRLPHDASTIVNTSVGVLEEAKRKTAAEADSEPKQPTKEQNGKSGMDKGLARLLRHTETQLVDVREKHYLDAQSEANTAATVAAVASDRAERARAEESKLRTALVDREATLTAAMVADIDLTRLNAKAEQLKTAKAEASASLDAKREESRAAMRALEEAQAEVDRAAAILEQKRAESARQQHVAEEIAKSVESMRASYEELGEQWSVAVKAALEQAATESRARRLAENVEKVTARHNEACVSSKEADNAVSEAEKTANKAQAAAEAAKMRLESAKKAVADVKSHLSAIATAMRGRDGALAVSVMQSTCEALTAGVDAANADSGVSKDNVIAQNMDVEPPSQSGVAAVLSALSDHPDSWSVQQAGVRALIALCADASVAAFVNGQNGHQLLLFSPFRAYPQLLQREVEVARALLSGPRRDALHSALGAIRHAVERRSIPAVLEALAQPPAPTELHAVCAAVAALLVLLSGSSQCARHAVEFAGASASSSAATAVATAAMRSGSVNPMAAQNVALALQLASQQFPRCEPLQRWVSRAKDIVDAVAVVQTAPDLATMLESLGLPDDSINECPVELQASPLSLLSIAARRARRAPELAGRAQVAELKRVLPRLRIALDHVAHDEAGEATPGAVHDINGRWLTWDKYAVGLDGESVVDALTDLHGMVEVAIWVISTDAKVHPSPERPVGWGEAYMPRLWKNGVKSMAKAKELIEDHGDLREWQVPKDPAKQLFQSLSSPTK